jgi:hypothetical protein
MGKLVAGPRWVPDTKTGRPTDCDRNILLASTLGHPKHMKCIYLLTEEYYWVLFYKTSFTLPTICWMYYYRLQINWVFLTNKKFQPDNLLHTDTQITDPTSRQKSALQRQERKFPTESFRRDIMSGHKSRVGSAPRCSSALLCTALLCSALGHSNSMPGGITGLPSKKLN